jgi:hypothetical protein
MEVGRMEPEKSKAGSFFGRYLISAIAIRLLLRVFWSDIGDAQGYAIPALGGIVVAAFLPAILEHRKWENAAEEQESSEPDIE